MRLWRAIEFVIGLMVFVVRRPDGSWRFLVLVLLAIAVLAVLRTACNS